MAEDNAQQNQDTNANDGAWKTAFGEGAAESLKAFNTPADFLGAFTSQGTELTTLKANPGGDWRANMAGGDEQLGKMFERFATPADAGKAYKSAVDKIRSGELGKPLPADATPEQIAEWRKGNGIPEKAEEYYSGKLPDGLVIGEDDAATFKGLAEVLHAHNAQPALAQALAKFYFARLDEDNAAISTVDKAHEGEAQTALREAWGTDFGANNSAVSNYLAGLPEGLRNALNGGFGGDGRKLMHNVEFMQWFANVAREHTPLGFVSPGGNETAMASLNEEIAKIEAMQKDQHGPYWKGPMAEKHQARLLQLYDKRLKMEKRVA